MKNKVYALSLVLILLLVQSCSEIVDESNKSVEHNVKAAQKLADYYGVEFEITNPELLTSTSLKEMEEMLQNISDDFKEPIICEWITTTENSITFQKEYDKSLYSRVKTRTEKEEITGMCKSYDFKVTLTWSFSDSEYDFSCSVSKDGISKTVSVDKSNIINGQNEIDISAKIRVIESSGSGYLHIPFEITGTYNKTNKSGSLTIKQS